jgi:hypothetical protein
MHKTKQHKAKKTSLRKIKKVRRKWDFFFVLKFTKQL